MIRCLFFIVVLGLAYSYQGCQKASPPEVPPCLPIQIAPQSPYDSPIWHPSGNFIGFNHTPLIRIEYPYGEHCQRVQYFESDSAGFWLINPNGTNMRRIFPYRLQTPTWSPDGEWIVFVVGSQIFKMRFVGGTFDTTTLTQLTFDGRNFFPAWRPDGEWIAYDNTVCGNVFEPPPPNSCGTLIMRNNGMDKGLVARGRMPSWSPDGRFLLFVGLRAEIFRVDVSDTAQTVRLTSFNQIGPYPRDNRHPRYSPDGTKIAVWSDFNIWMMDSSGASPRRLTTEGVDPLFSWSPDGTAIIYTVYRSHDWGYDNGVIWMVNPYTGQRRQLTFNERPEN